MKISMPEYIEILSEKHTNELKSLGDVKLFSDFPKTDDEIIKRIGDAELLLFKWLRISNNVLEKCPSIKYIIALSVGINQVNAKKAKEMGIKIINCPTHNAYSVTEHILALMFAVSRNIVEAQTLIKNGKWKSSVYSFTSSNLSGKKLGLIGYGQIGKQVEILAKGVGMKTAYVNSKSSEKEVDDLISSSDYINLSLTYNDKSFHLIDKRRLKIMKKTAYLINTSRGALIDQKILIKYLKENKIAGAAMDVFENEPINADPTPEIIELVNLPNVVATPHMAYNTKEAAYNLGEEMIKNVKACISGKPINVRN